MRIILLLLPALLLWGCVDKKRNPISDLDYHIEYDTLVSPVTDTIGFDFLVSNIYSDTVFLVFKNKGEDTLYLASLNDSNQLNIERRICLMDTSLFSNHDSLGVMQSVVFINKDSLLFAKFMGQCSASRVFIYSLSKNERVFERTFMPLPFGMREKKEVVYLSHDIMWNKNKGNILATFINGYDTTTQYNFLLEINTADTSQRILRYEFPEKYQNLQSRRGIYPFKDVFDIEMDENGVLYVAFGVSSEIYIIQGDSFKTIDLVNSNYTEPLVYEVEGNSTNGDQFLDIAKRTFTFKNFLYDKYNQCFYRFYDLAMLERDENGLVTNIDNKQSGLTVFSKDFSSMKEVLLIKDNDRDYQFTHATIVSKRGILLFNTRNNQIIIRTLKIER